MADKRYQVFVSSTYEDLQQERQEVMQALLELDCIPSGMELFPAANDDQWTLIRKVIDDCDYYIVIVGGRYGSIGPGGVGYTEMEYRYALESGKPIIGFLHRDPGSLQAKKTESSTEGKTKLAAFRELVQKKLVRTWTGPSDLGSVVSRSLIQLIRTNPAIGWVRGDVVSAVEATQEILRLKKKIEELQSTIDENTTNAPPGTERLAQGDDSIQIKYSFISSKGYSDRISYSASFDTSWSQIFSRISPHLINEASENAMKKEINEFISDQGHEEYRANPDFKGRAITNFEINDEDFQTIKIQFKALGLVAKSVKSRSVKDRASYWTLTPYGESIMTKSRAIQKSAAQ
jgi:hypothetical protein